MATLLAESEAPSLTKAPAASAPILVATDGSENATIALRTAAWIAVQQGCGVEVVSVLEPLPIITPDAMMPIPMEVETERRADRLARVRAQLYHVTGNEQTWPTELMTGSPAPCIDRAARERGARLIVVGLGEHGFTDRLFGEETALQLLRIANVPVLCVAPPAVGHPRRVVASVDFSETAARALRAALPLLDKGTTLYLTHVVSREVAMSAWSEWATLYQESAEEGFDALIKRLEIPDEIIVERRILRGDPGREITRLASEVNADLIVAGSHGHGLVSRMLLGSTATRIIRHTRCSVLGVPRNAIVGAMPHATSAGPATRVGEERRWTHMLDEVTRRNLGRRTSLEVDDPDIGAQAQETDYPLLGICYDHHDHAVEIALGRLGAGSAHLSRVISDVSEVTLLRDTVGRDHAVRIAHGRGQTLLRFDW